MLKSFQILEKSSDQYSLYFDCRKIMHILKLMPSRVIFGGSSRYLGRCISKFLSVGKFILLLKMGTFLKFSRYIYQHHPKNHFLLLLLKSFQKSAQKFFAAPSVARKNPFFPIFGPFPVDGLPWRGDPPNNPDGFKIFESFFEDIAVLDLLASIIFRPNLRPGKHIFQLWRYPSSDQIS